MYDWGMQKYGVTLHIDEAPTLYGNDVVVDVEDNEQGVFVGLGICDGKDVYYFSKITEELKKALKNKTICGHAVKYDYHQLKSWGFDISPEQLIDDTQLMAYTLDSTNRDNGLKSLSKKYLGIEYPTYKEIVGKGKTKKTLDKQDVVLVANYCGMDCYCTWKLREKLQEVMTNKETEYYQEIEVPTLKILAEMEEKRVFIDVEALTKLDAELKQELIPLEQYYDGLELNPRSPKQVLRYLHDRNVNVTTTASELLEYYAEHEDVERLLKYRKLQKLHSTYTQSLLNLTDLPWTRPNFNQALTVTGRLSSSEPINWQNMPRSEGDEYGTRIRNCVSAPNGFSFISADFSQIEYRLLAHFTQEPILVKAFKEGKDVHEETSKMLGVDRHVGKTLNFCVIYGGKAKKVSKVAGVTEEDAEEFLRTYWDRLPTVKAWVERVIWNAQRDEGVETLGGRFILIKEFDSNDRYERLSAERQAVSYKIQGSAADIMKIAMIKLKENGYVGRVTVHDEVDFIVPEETVDQDVAAIREIMSECVKLTVPLDAEVKAGKNWSEAKQK